MKHCPVKTLLVVQFGGVPEGLATSIAAALFYEQPSDPIAMQLKQLREEQGIDYMLEIICRLDKEADKQLITLIKEKIEMLRERVGGMKMRKIVFTTSFFQFFEYHI